MGLLYTKKKISIAPPSLFVSIISHLFERREVERK